MRNVSFKVSNLEESHAIQKMLFATGAKWISSGKQLKDYGKTEIRAFCVDSNGNISNNTLDNADFDFVAYEVVTTVEVKIIDTRPKIVFQGQTYVVSDIERAISNAGVIPL